LTKTLAIEGAKHGILANVLVPTAGTAMTKTVWPQEMVDKFKPDYLAPLVCFLSSSENQKQTGGVFESWAGWVGQYRWQRAGGYAFPAKSIPTPEDYAEKYAVYTNFEDGRATNPSSALESTQQMLAHFSEEEDPPAKAKL
jgi:multifunctional beta-oxidation protein